MKAIRNLPARWYSRLLAVLLVTALSACSLFSGPSAPVVQMPAQAAPGQGSSGEQTSPGQPQTPSSAPASTPAAPGTGAETADASVLRPTVEPVPALSEGMASFPGLYWTEDLLVEALPEGVKVTAPFPCTQLLNLLGSGEWRVTGQAIPAVTMNFSPALARLEWDGQVALVRAEDLGVEVDLEALQGGVPAPTAAPDPNTITGCTATLEPVSVQAVEASGTFEGSGDALAYPLLLGCVQVEDTMSVNMIYEGPGSLRANLTFSVPPTLGEHELDFDNLDLNLSESERSVIDEYARVYAQGEQGEDDDDFFSFTEFYPMGEQAGWARISSLDPLAGEVEFVDWESESGEVQSFRAGFRCSNPQGTTP